MVKIVREIQAGVVKKKEACRKYGLNRNTLVNWMRRLSVRTLPQDGPDELILSITEKQQDRALHQKIKELTRALEQAHLKAESLETMIKVAEEELLMKENISISMTQNGSPYENALAERINGILKHEFCCDRIYSSHQESQKLIYKTINVYNQNGRMVAWITLPLRWPMKNKARFRSGGKNTGTPKQRRRTP